MHLWTTGLLHILSGGEKPHFPPKIGKPSVCFVPVLLGGRHSFIHSLIHSFTHPFIHSLSKYLLGVASVPGPH